MKLPGSLLWRTLAVVIVALVASQAISLWLLHENVTRPRQAEGLGQFVSHLKSIRAALDTVGPDQQAAFIAKIAERDGIRIVPVTGDENVRPVAPGRLMAFRERLRALFGPDTELYVRPGSPMALWVRIPAQPRDLWVVFPRQRVDRDPFTALAGWSVAGLAIALVATILIAWWLTRPLARFSEAAEQLGKGGDPPPLPERGPSEIKAVARAFNQMKDDLKRQERERATFLAGISHDLRTPLARLRLELEMQNVDPQAQRAMVADIDDMNAIIDQFIDFARSEAAEPLSPVSLSEVARAASERAARDGADVRCEPADVPSLMLRPLAIQRLVDNLVGNAHKHAGGPILVRTERTPRGVALSVLDRGPGIAPGDAERLKAPFTRKDDARSGQSGAGLGLAIASRIAAIHLGTLDLLPRDGGGLEARVEFPKTEGS